MNGNLDEKIETLAKLLYKSRYPVIFTGAGISTESGLPDFRGPDGMWTRRDKGLAPKPMSKSWNSVEPNSGHLAIVELQKIGKLKFLIVSTFKVISFIDISCRFRFNATSGVTSSFITNSGG